MIIKLNKMAKGRKKKVQEVQEPIEQPIVDITAPAQEDEPKLESAGLGDTVAKITEFLGIEKCEPCEERRKKWNKQFPWLTPQDLDKLEGEDAELLERVKKTPHAVKNEDVIALFALYNKVFSPKRPVKRCQCPGLLRMIVERLDMLVQK
jgi:hypothetical protein